jgi:hypothetical protein
VDLDAIDPMTGQWHVAYMIGASDPNILIGEIALGGLALAAFLRLIVWIRDAPARPDPWDAEVERKLSEAVEVCPHCLTEQPPTAWFCKGCGRATGPYNNLMPYLQVFSEGEVFRNGASGQFRNRPLILAGYFLVILGTFPLLAPLYLVWLLTSRRKAPGGEDPRQSTE